VPPGVGRLRRHRERGAHRRSTAQRPRSSGIKPGGPTLVDLLGGEGSCHGGAFSFCLTSPKLAPRAPRWSGRRALGPPAAGRRCPCNPSKRDGRRQCADAHGTDPVCCERMRAGTGAATGVCSADPTTTRLRQFTRGLGTQGQRRRPESTRRMAVLPTVQSHAHLPSRGALHRERRLCGARIGDVPQAECIPFRVLPLVKRHRRAVPCRPQRNNSGIPASRRCTTRDVDAHRGSYRVTAHRILAPATSRYDARAASRYRMMWMIRSMPRRKWGTPDWVSM
jgi:hypothetical protein